MPHTILTLGAHADDCVFGVPGILCKAVAQGHRVVIATLIGGDDPALVARMTDICREFGAETRFLDFASQQMAVTPEAVRRVAGIVAEVAPDTVFLLWPHDHHRDHEMAAQLCRIPLRQSHRILPDGPYKLPKAVYAYDNGPGHAIDFTPDTYVDITDVWPTAREWLSRVIGPTTEGQHPLLQCKEVLARYRGYACDVTYAEALRAMVAAPRELW